MNIKKIKEKQLEFYRSGKAGCVFAAVAAKDPKKYEWGQTVLTSIDPHEIDHVIDFYKRSSEVSTLSIIFPHVHSMYDLCTLIYSLEKCKNIIIEKAKYNNYDCFGIRVKYEDKVSWVTGFGPFSFFPETRQAPFTEISFRIKPKPQYDYELKESPEDVLHLAHMDIKNVGEKTFKKYWDSSLKNTEKRLGHKPDFISAAKTSFSIPREQVENAA
ncbi:hypothetical protein [Vibrio parahaemolyticus]|uniref:hypothetical protein n=1 Tax=Vibrio parahaemolyticus TaxID=670 RepID=UPI000D54AB67|nr:hypothetical protein [Vibrio parahaemolyticus]AWG85907.1 hypothetical protein Vp2S01_A0422 [Vibrio parahaemolyticus]EJI1392327.1 hypothetical protein [Vibrio parahaemolyticus]ELB2247198.1 hypothetical protein [Vibrio parahaemolyticus]ELB2250257.1 hypothetical protein [Vibrio parahaemolyticus]ELM4062670.1 hypothetical protein [Vibrio parahaemolyticus]